jgi:lysyl-tRNA synthetase class 2
MKRLLAAGYERIVQICHCWRQEERGTRHLPEFSMLEWYRSQGDYTDLMAECESLLRFILSELHGTTVMTFRNTTVDLTPPWERITVADAFNRYTDSSMETALQQGTFDDLMVERIEPQLGVGSPTFIIDYPASRAALARLKPDNHQVAERFELYLAGMELANAFTELIDPVEQRSRFLAEREERAALGKTPYPLPSPFLDEMSAMSPCAGIALGFDRLVMLLTNSETIDDVVAFTPEEL